METLLINRSKKISLHDVLIPEEYSFFFLERLHETKPKQKEPGHERKNLHV